MTKASVHSTLFFQRVTSAEKPVLRLVPSEKFNLEGALAVCLSISKSLRAIHNRAELHRAICPANIQIDADGSAELRHDVRMPLGYMSPEQTGRMNRAVDYRSDYYSLGVVFYELLTGRPPFPFDDAMELVHSHIAKQAIPPHKVDDQIPQPVSDMVMKLLSKNAEDRYQSLDGLWADLHECQIALLENGSIPPFELGRHDICDRLQISQKLYGREREIGQLISAFNRVVESKTELLLVTGYSGIGKSSLINEIHRPVVARRGYFAVGKFDQFKPDIPYYAIVEAFRELIRQILTESETRIADWKIRLLDALGQNGRIMIDAIPDLEYVIGAQPTVPTLEPNEAQNRLNYVVQNFISVFAQSGQPLVMFLDDLQWADEASLKLIQLFMTAKSGQSLLLIGSYRDNEIEPAGSLMQAIEAIKKQGTVVSTIELRPLSEPSVTALVADTLRVGQDRVNRLARLIHHKTLGNPFFVGQFIKSLYGSQLLKSFDGKWYWDIHQIEALAITDNVVDLLTQTMLKLPAQTQHLLTLAACIGVVFALKVLGEVEEKDEQEIKLLLQPAVQAGLVTAPLTTYSATSGTFTFYRFLHDKVQQAAYGGIDAEARKAVHLKIGRLLLKNVPADQREERLFDIVQQLNEGKELLQDDEERHELAELNLQAAKKAKLTVAHEAALKHACTGIALLESAQATATRLYFSLLLEKMEASLLSHRFNDVDAQGEHVLEFAASNFERALVLNVLIQSCQYQDRQAEAIMLAYRALRLLGIEMPEKIGKLQLIYRLLKVRRLLNARTTEQLLALPVEKNPVEILKQNLLSGAISACYVANPAIFPLLIFEQVSITLKNGRYTPTSPYSMAGYAMVLIQGFGAIKPGYELGKLVLALAKKNKPSVHHQNSPGIRIHYVVHALIEHWQQHLSSTITPLYETYQAGLQIGEFEYASYSLVSSVRAELIIGRSLASLRDRMRTALVTTQQLKQKISSDTIGICLRYVSALMGETEQAEPTGLEQLEKITKLTRMHWHLFEAAKAYLFADAKGALASITQSETYLGSAACMATLPLYNVYHSLCLLACYPGMDRDSQRKALTKIEKLQKKLKLWARHAPMNYLHKWQLVEAERFRVLGDQGRAETYYDLTISGARAHGYISEEALANELAGNFYLGIGRKMYARSYLEEAHALYRRWGALAKVRHLEQAHPGLLMHMVDRDRSVGPAVAASEQRLDIGTVIKASQTLSREIQLDKLLEKLMRLLIENAGAQKGLLLLQENGTMKVQARIEADEIEVLQGMPITESSEMSLGVIHYVKRTQERIVLGDAEHDNRFNADPYIERARPKSVLCIPLKKQSELVGILYLENNLAADVFTPERIELLQILSTQIAISLENASLYNELEQKIEARTQALSQKNTELNETLSSLKQMQRQLVESEKLASLGQLVAGVAHEINTPVGIGVTGASTLSEETSRLEEAYQAGTMRRSDLDHYLNTASTISKLLLSNMERAAMLIQSFKAVAIDQTSEERRIFNLKAYIEDVLLNLNPALRKAECRVIVECPERMEIDNYPGAFSQIFTNLTMNALTHAFHGRESAAITITVCERDVDAIELYFSDNGRGIPQENLPKIFDPFFTTTRGNGGSGLGLNIVHNLVTGRLQGQIAVESRLDEGTTFVLTFPRSPAKSVSAAVAA